VNERDQLRLRHILDAAERISGYLEGVDLAAFLANRMLQDAVIRNRLVRGYFDVDLRVVWQTARESLPSFVRQVGALLAA
jgi:uncharacterized protein with HEPN domain